MSIVLKRLNKSFRKEVLRDINLEVSKGEIVALLGPSGSGKSTILRIIAKLESADNGEVEVNEELSFVFQHPLLMEWRTAKANASLPLEIQGLSQSEIEKRCNSALQLVGLSKDGDLYPDQLSGGMQMRVSLARALVTNPKILLLDEPFAALDEMTRERLNLEVLKLREQEEISTLFVTHNIFEAVFMSDRILVLGNEPATVIAEIENDLLHPRKAEIKGTTHFSQIVAQVQQALIDCHE